MKSKLSILIILLFALALGACGDDKNSDRDIQGTPDADTSSPKEDVKDPGADINEDPNKDAQGPDSDAQSDPDATQEPPDGHTPPEFDANRPDTSGPGVSGSCERVEELGVLDLGNHFFTVVFELDNDHVRTSCRSMSAPTKPEKIYKFSVEQQTMLELEAGDDYIFEVREDPCGEESSVVACNPNGSIVGQALLPDTDYYLIVELDEEINDFTENPEESEYNFGMSLRSPFSECRPGLTQCESSSEVRICEQSGAFSTRSCLAGCSDYTCDPDTMDCDDVPSGCAGDSCLNPIAVEGQEGASIQGDIGGFANQHWTYTCDGESAAGLLAGQEVVFLAEGLSAGQTIKIDASNEVDDYTFIVQRDACGEEAACAMRESNDSGTASHEVSEAGDYYIIIDSSGALNGQVDYQVSVE